EPEPPSPPLHGSSPSLFRVTALFFPIPAIFLQSKPLMKTQRALEKLYSPAPEDGTDVHRVNVGPLDGLIFSLEVGPNIDAIFNNWAKAQTRINRSVPTAEKAKVIQSRSTDGTSGSNRC